MAQLLERLNQIRSGVTHIAAGLVAGLALAAVGNITGCNSYLLNQVEQDVATSTIEPRINSIDSTELIEFRQQNKEANEKLAKMRLYAQGGTQ